MQNTLNISGLTQMENQVLSDLIENLYAEPGFSDIAPIDISKSTGIPMNSLRGVLGSLSKKSIIWIASEDEYGTDFPIVYLCSDYYYLHPEWKNDIPYSDNPENKTYEQLHNDTLNS